MQIWDAATGNLLSAYKGHSHSVYTLAWSPDGTRIASAGADRSVQVWDAKTGELHCIGCGHSECILALTWSPDGRYVASAGRDKTVQVWLVEDRKHQLPGTGIDDGG